MRSVLRLTAPLLHPGEAGSTTDYAD
jgi:hypothetical protein